MPETLIGPTVSPTGAPSVPVWLVPYLLWAMVLIPLGINAAKSAAPHAAWVISASAIWDSLKDFLPALAMSSPGLRKAAP